MIGSEVFLSNHNLYWIFDDCTLFLINLYPLKGLRIPFSDNTEVFGGHK